MTSRGHPRSALSLEFLRSDVTTGGAAVIA